MRHLLVIVVFVIHSILCAQTPSETKDQRLVEETNKKSALAASILSDKFDKHLASIKDVPEKFRDESVVILFNSSNYFIEKTDQIYFVERVKTRVYLKDKAAVEKYSTYYTSGYEETNSSEVTIIKANGISRTLQLKDGIKETNYASIPLYYKSSVTLNQTYYKFALPDLEPGDIVDFTQTSKNPMGILTGNIPFTRIYLASEFPVVKTFVTIDVPTKDSYIYLKSLNGAPEMSRKDGLNGLVTFTLEDSLRDKVENDWNLPREKFLPHVKFILTRFTGADNIQVLPVRTSNNRIQTKLSNAELTRSTMLVNVYHAYSSKAAKLVMSEVLAKNPTAKKDADKLIELCWYYVRNKLTNKEPLTPIEYYVPSSIYEMYIIDVFIEILHTKKQTFDLILTTNNKSAGIKNVISPMEISWGVRWKDKYITYPTFYMQFGELPNYLNGSDALIVPNFSFKSKTPNFTDYVLPNRPYNENAINIKVDASLNEGFDKIVCTRTMSSTKGSTSIYIADYFNREFNDDQLKYLNLYKVIDSSRLYWGPHITKAIANELRRKHKEEQANYYKSIRDGHIDLVKSEYPMMDEYETFKMIGYGVTPNSPDFSMEEKFTLNDLVKRAGNGYMISIGALLGDYNKFPEEYSKRNYSGSLELATVKTMTIKLAIPEGYKVTILESANKSFSDNFVALQSSLKVEGNTVIFSVTREVKKTDFTAEEYASMVKYFDIMYELTQIKIVLKK